MPGFNLADMFEMTADAVPERVALVLPERTVTYGELEGRANRLAHHLASQGVGPGDHVAVDAYNGREWIEILFALFKLRAVAINVNYRYVADELEYVLDNSDAVALVFHRSLGEPVAKVVPRLPGLRHLVAIDDGSDVDVPPGALDYETALAEAAPVRNFLPRSGDDEYILYTGGTTGPPKGVMWRQEDLFFAALRGAAAPWGIPTRPEELAQRAPNAKPSRWLLPAPMHHAGGQFGSIGSLLAGNTLIIWTGRHFDAHALWDLVERHRVHSIGVVGDAMARPLADALAERPVETRSLVSFGSGGAVFSPAVREQLHGLLPHVVLADSLGSTETGVDAVRVIDDADFTSGPPRFQLGDAERVVDEHFRTVEPGSGVVGRVARSGHIPLGYYGDPERTAATFPVIDGVRWSVPGDHATVDADGTVRLLGRGSVSINTGGEKVYPEEVEAVLKGFPTVADALVVGVPDERWGEAVSALVQTRDGMPLDLTALDTHCRDRLAGYKVPRRVEVVPLVVRHPSGKPDYTWAREHMVGSAQLDGTPR